jgi:hypothetical protein
MRLDTSSWSVQPWVVIVVAIVAGVVVALCAVALTLLLVSTPTFNLPRIDHHGAYATPHPQESPSSRLSQDKGVAARGVP